MNAELISILLQGFIAALLVYMLYYISHELPKKEAESNLSYERFKVKKMNEMAKIDELADKVDRYDFDNLVEMFGDYVEIYNKTLSFGPYKAAKEAKCELIGVWRTLESLGVKIYVNGYTKLEAFEDDILSYIYSSKFVSEKGFLNEKENKHK